MKTDINFIGFAPDIDASTPGVITGGAGFIPTLNGVGPVKSLVNIGYPALAAACRGAAVVRLVDDTKRIFAGTQTKLYEGSALAWNDVSVGAGSYVGGAENKWRFAQYGNDTIATNYVDAVQVSNSSGAFSNLGGTPPKAAIVETCSGFVMLFDTNDGSNVYHDGWACSALQNDASWAASIATQAANGRLLDTPGAIRAAKSLGNIMVAYKERSMYLGFYDGPPVIWRWQLVPGEVGCVSQEAIVNVLINGAPAQIFAGYDDIYMFDGTKPISLGAPLRTWYNTNSNAKYRYKTQAMHDPAKQLVYFYLPDSNGDLTLCIPYNYKTDKWGYLGTIGNVEAALQYIAGGTTYEDLGSLYTTYDDIPEIAYDSPYWTSGAPVPAIFNNAHTIVSYTGTAGSSTINCNYSGDGDTFVTLDRIRPKFNDIPDSGTCNVLYSQKLGDPSPSTVATASLNNNKFDLMKSSKFFAPQMTFVGDYEITGFSLLFEIDGEE